MRLLLFSFFFILFLSSNAQLLDTSDIHVYKPIEVSTISEVAYLQLRADSTYIDTSIANFQNNYKAYSDYFPFVDLGLEGSSILSLSAGSERKHGFDLGLTNLTYYFFDDTVRLYQTTRPFTRLNYSQGKNELINISATHAQRLSKRLAFGLDYHRLKNQNFYYSNIANASRIRMNNLFNLKLYTNYCSKDRRYELLVSYLWNKSVNVESGGLLYDSVFNALTGRNKIDNNEAKFTEAFGQQSQNKFTIIQYFRPQKSIKDTSQVYNIERFSNQFYLKTTTDFRNVRFWDESPDSANYGFSLSAFEDSIIHRAYNNEFGYSVKLKTFNLSAGILHSLNTITMNEVSESFNNVHLLSLAQLNIKQFNINASASLGVLGYNLGDYKLTGIANTTWKGFSVSAGILSQLAEPFYLEQRLASNVVSWNNDFGKTSINQLFGTASLSNAMQLFKINLLSETNYNLVYFDTDLQAKQYQDFISLIKLTTTHSLTLKRFGTNANITLQQVSNNTIMPRPAVSGTLDLFTNFRLFKKNLAVQLGAKSFWFSAFNSPRYNPYTRQWHLTNETYSLYPPISVYANAKLKSFCFGIEFFHVQQQLMGADYYASPGYPLMPRVMRLNIRWDLSN